MRRRKADERGCGGERVGVRVYEEVKEKMKKVVEEEEEKKDYEEEEA